ncbi:MAG: hypothetical protein R2810_04790 [Flavobacteriales bacterium]
MSPATSWCAATSARAGATGAGSSSRPTDGGQMELYYETGVMVSGERYNAGGEVVEKR